MFMRCLVRLRELEPALRLGWSVPRIKRDCPALAAVAVPGYAALYLRRRVGARPCPSRRGAATR